MKRGAQWLSRNVEELARRQEEERRPPSFDVLVVGSGYGGAVAAARLSALAEGDGEAFKVCVLERGLEYPPGYFPAGLSELVGHQRISGAAALGGQSLPDGLMDWHVGGDVWALVANGLGGGSLINAGVCAPAQPTVLDREDWPDPWRGNEKRWQGLYARVHGILGAEEWPMDVRPKQLAMRLLAGASGGESKPVHLTIALPDSKDVEGNETTVALNHCAECGDCFTGCNFGAKRTLSHNYLSRAYRQGAELYCGATVLKVTPLTRAETDAAPRGPRWAVSYVFTNPMLLPGCSEPFVVFARHVVLGAGTFGSTEILMRSRSQSFQVSGRLGEGFSANGDMLAAFYDTGTEVKLSPEETDELSTRKVGPTITSQIEWPARGGDAGTRGTAKDVMQDLGVPGALGWIFREVMTTMMVPQRWTRFDFSVHHPKDVDIFAVDERKIRNTLLTVSYVDDGAAGRLEQAPGWGGALRDGSVVVRWNRPADGEWFKQADERLKERVPAGSFLLRNPLTQFMPKANYLGIAQTSSRLLSVHPLGGCRMGKSADKGVVDAWGRVFDIGIDLSDRADPSIELLRARYDHRVEHALHEGLYVLDGSIVPTALGINPLMTITALAEGAIDQWKLEYGWCEPQSRLGDLPLPLSKPPHTVLRSPTDIRFEERMTAVIPAWPTMRPPQGRSFRLSMRAKFKPIDNLQAFLRLPVKSVRLKAYFDLGLQQAASNSPPANDEAVSPAGTEFSVKGEIKWMTEEQSCVGQRVWRSARTYWLARRPADKAGDDAALKDGRPPTTLPTSEFVTAATHFGAVRQLAYEFEPIEKDWHLLDPALEDNYGTMTLPAGTVLYGAKRVGYLFTEPVDCKDEDSNYESANPWYQLTNLRLYARTPTGQVIELGKLEFDPMAMIDRYDLPLKVTKQTDMLTGMRDIASLALYFGRVMFGLHMLNFRRPDYPVEVTGRRELMRLPPRYEGTGRYNDLDVSFMDVPQTLPGGEIIRLRLTRIRPKTGATKGRPVLMLHGFGSGGIQFTHPGIDVPMAPWLAQEHGRDVWVGELRTSIGLPTVERQWVMDDVAKEDVPLLVKTVSRLTTNEPIDVVAHCIGSAMFCMAALSGSLQDEKGKSRIFSAALMQVGPYVTLPRISRTRGYVGMRLQQIFGLAKASSVASQDPSDMESILDRLLGTYLYKQDQRKYYRLSGDNEKNIRRTNANRSAGIFGQLFQYENMSPGVLDKMDDLLGDCNLSTYAQTAQYAFGGRLTDQCGNDVYVTDRNMRAYFTFPVMFLHGEKNQTFDFKTFGKNVELAKRLGLTYVAHPVEGYGHLDCVVGNQAMTKVFKPVNDFLNLQYPVPVAQTPGEAIQADFRPRLPAVGPWIGDFSTQGATGPLYLRVAMRIDDMGQSLRDVCATAGKGATVQNFFPQSWMRPLQQCCVVLNVDAQTLAPYLAADSAPKTPLEVLLSPVHDGTAADADAFRAKLAAKEEELKADARRRGVPLVAIPGLLLDGAWLRRQFDEAQQDLGVVLGSCRQRPLLVDRDMADRSMRHIHEQLGDTAEPPEGHAPVDAVILAGDQIYGDSRADSTHPGTSGGRFFDAYREAWTATWQREVMRRRPVYMVVDDHEFRNDYNDQITVGRPEEFAAARAAWKTYELVAGPARIDMHKPDSAWRKTALRGFGIFFTDTRSDRQDLMSVDRAGAKIMSDAQMKALRDWLLELHNDKAYGKRAKIVVVASPFAPLFADSPGKPSVLDGDGWQRFPESQAELLGWIADHEIDNVLFLAGDYHRYARCSMTIQAKGKNKVTGMDLRAVTATSIVAGGLYAPYPFANADREEWLGPTFVQTTLPGRPDLSWSYTLEEDAGGDGYVRLTLSDNGKVLSKWIEMPPWVSRSSNDTQGQVLP